MDLPFWRTFHPQFISDENNLRRQWAQWCVSVYPTRADPSILSRSTLRSLTPRKEEAVEEARKRIDHVLSNPR